jgi:hypothetical protein
VFYHSTSLCVCIFTESYSPPPIHHLDLLESPSIGEAKLLAAGKAEVRRSEGDALELKLRICCWYREQGWQVCFCAKILIGKRGKDFLHMPSLLWPKPYPLPPRQGFSQEGRTGPGVTGVVSSSPFSAEGSTYSLLVAEKPKRAGSGCAALPTNGSFSPLCGSAAPSTAHLAFLAPDSHMSSTNKDKGTERESPEGEDKIP